MWNGFIHARLGNPAISLTVLLNSLSFSFSSSTSIYVHLNTIRHGRTSIHKILSLSTWFTPYQAASRPCLWSAASGIASPGMLTSIYTWAPLKVLFIIVMHCKEDFDWTSKNILFILTELLDEYSTLSPAYHQAIPRCLARQNNM